MSVIFSSVIADIIFALVVIFVVLYFYFTWAFKYWKKRGIHYVEPTLFVGNLGSVLSQKEGLIDLFRRIHMENVGHKVVGIFIFHKPTLLVRDLDLIRSVLVKDAHAFLNRFFTPPEKISGLLSRSLLASKGKKWRHLRIKLTPTFTSRKMKRMFQLVEETTNHLLLNLDHEVSEGRSVAMKDTMSRYTMDTIASCALGVNANALEDPNSRLITSMKKLFQPSGFIMFWSSLVVFIPWLQIFVTEKFLDSELIEFVRNMFWDVVNHRKAKGIVRQDVVDLLVQLREDGEVRAEDARDLEEIEQDSKYVNLEGSKTDDTDISKYNELVDDDIVAQALTFKAAGYETSSSVMTFTLVELAMNPAIQDKLRREIEDILDKHQHKITYDAIADMSYLDMVIAESMRKYPPLSFLERECLMDCKFEGTDIVVEKGTVVLIPVNAIHYDPEIFPDPEKFDPERFNAEAKRNRSNFAYLPFGEGPRKCIGMRFGLMQVKTGLVHILKKFQVRTCKDTPKLPLEMKSTPGLLSPKEDIVLDLIKLK